MVEEDIQMDQDMNNRKQMAMKRKKGRFGFDGTGQTLKASGVVSRWSESDSRNPVNGDTVENVN